MFLIRGISVKEERRLLHSLLEVAGGRTTTYRHMGTAAFAIYQAKSQGFISQSADKWQTERIPC